MWNDVKEIGLVLIGMWLLGNVLKAMFPPSSTTPVHLDGAPVIPGQKRA